MSILYRKHEIFPESILIRDFEDCVTVDEIIASWEYLLSNSLLSNITKGVINNLTGCNLQMNIESFKRLIAYLRSQEIFKSIKLAVVCDNPQIIVFPTLGEVKITDLNIKPFTTVEAAVDWILMG